MYTAVLEGLLAGAVPSQVHALDYARGLASGQ